MGDQLDKNSIVNSNIFDNGANVGIGTVNPTGKLEVNLVNPSGWTGNLKALKILSPDNSYYLDVNTYIVGGGNVGYQFSPNANVGLVLTTPGNVGIWTNIPSERLAVVGNILASGNVTANGFIYNSDRNLKKNITPLSGSLEKILALSGYSFDWKSTGTKDIGVIAQEVETVFPELVHTNSEGIKSVEYGNLIAPLIEAMKTQQKEIESLKSEVASLKASK